MDADADAWLHRFSYYTDYKRLNDEQQIKLFKLLMSDAAADWMRTLPREAMASFKELSQRFSDRFIANAASKNTNEAALWGCRQGTHESAEEFVTAMQRIAARIPVNDILARHNRILKVHTYDQFLCTCLEHWACNYVVSVWHG